ncbi:hypothetical protein GAO09_13195 [Rhizobiales bacterium RZME27]|uniref:Uncharacterized protein n=1 Tax=Endobacterium cereale TaxID=2663029 RepID=A0A6A8AAQ7_9HYPH|nr:hypothetical protein [Endobacterium cereale]MEB2844397.1 hypothetical protein [Endobacterium cereale]MQY46987.1 hypothetical protein [Endobacterium cereale]
MTFPEISLPSRPLALKQSSLSLPRGYAISLPIVFLLTGLLFYWQAPNLWRDYQISQNPLVMEDGRLVDGECKVRKGVFTDCDARVAYTYQGKSYESDTHIFFVDAHSGNYETDIVISADNPELATLSLGLDKLENRFISFGVLFGVFAIICLISIVLGVRTSYARSRLTTPALLTPVPVEIATYKESFGRLLVTYADKIADDKTKRTAYSRFAKGQEPIIIGEFDGSPVGLAVRHGNTAYPVLLDAGLERIKMTDEERAAALASIATARETVADEQPSLREPPKKGRFLRVIIGFLAIILVIAGLVLGYWYWYVTAGYTQFMQAGMEINNMLPAPMNEWGCDQLQKRFGDQNAPYGCTASDFKSWK